MNIGHLPSSNIYNYPRKQNVLNFDRCIELYSVWFFVKLR